MAATINPTLLLVIALAPLVGAIVAGLFGKTIGRAASHSVTTGSVALSCALSLYVLWQVIGGAHYDGTVYTWMQVGQLRMDVGFLIDSLSALMMVSIVFRPDDIADNMRKSGSFIPGIRPGRRTSDYINDILTRITLVGAVYLILISLVPTFLISGIHLNHLWLVGNFFERLPAWVTNGLHMNFYFGGTSLLIVVGVAMDTANQIESQLIMRHYDGFSARSGRVRGRKTW